MWDLKRHSLCATTHFGYTFLDLESLTPMGKEPSWDIKNPLSKKFFIFKKCPILMILWNFPNQPKSHPSAIFDKKNIHFSWKILTKTSKLLKNIQKKALKLKKINFHALLLFKFFFLQKIEFRPTVWWRVPHLDFFSSLNVFWHYF